MSPIRQELDECYCPVRRGCRPSGRRRRLPAVESVDGEFNRRIGSGRSSPARGYDAVVLVDWGETVRQGVEDLPRCPPARSLPVELVLRRDGTSSGRQAALRRTYTALSAPCDMIYGVNHRVNSCELDRVIYSRVNYLPPPSLQTVSYEHRPGTAVEDEIPRTCPLRDSQTRFALINVILQHPEQLPLDVRTRGSTPA